MAQSDDQMGAMRNRMDQIGDRQEVMITAMDGQTDCIAILNDKVSELIEWLQEPPKNDLGETMKGLTAALKSLEATIERMPERVADLVISRLR